MVVDWKSINCNKLKKLYSFKEINCVMKYSYSPEMDYFFSEEGENEPLVIVREGMIINLMGTKT